MNDLLYFLVGPIVVGIFGLLYMWSNKEWKTVTKEEIWEIWDDNASKFGTVEDFARKLERKLEERNT